jgi:hypothetical protein
VGLSHRWAHQLIDRRLSLPEFFQQKRGVFSSKWKYLPRSPGNFFRTVGNLCRAEFLAENFRRNAFSASPENRCLSESESGAARRLPKGPAGKTPDELHAQYQNGETNVL